MKGYKSIDFKYDLTYITGNNTRVVLHTHRELLNRISYSIHISQNSHSADNQTCFLPCEMSSPTIELENLNLPVSSRRCIKTSPNAVIGVSTPPFLASGVRAYRLSFLLRIALSDSETKGRRKHSADSAIMTKCYPKLSDHLSNQPGNQGTHQLLKSNQGHHFL